MSTNTLTPTLLVWWKFGREQQNDEEIRQNPQDVVRQHLQRKVDRSRKQPAGSWRWYQAAPDLIVERWDDTHSPTGPNTTIYYLLDCGLAVIEDIVFPPPDDRWKWYIHIADYLFEPDIDAWLMKDLFVDVIVQADNRTCEVMDLPELARALDAGVITQEQSHAILERADWLVNKIAAGKFPMDEVQRGREACKKLGWR
jgi:hypothetical protein